MSNKKYGKVNCIIHEINEDKKEMILINIDFPLEKKFVKVNLADESNWIWINRLKEIIKRKIVYIALDFEGLKFEYV